MPLAPHPPVHDILFMHYFSSTLSGNLTLSLIAMGLGLLIGSFLNVVIYRLPIMMQRAWDNELAQATHTPIPHTTPYNLFLPASSCTQCHHAIAYWHTIPLLSYLLLRRRCAHCQQTISLRYPCVELLSSAAAALLVWHYGTGLFTLYALVFIYMMITLACIDAHTQLLPDQLTLSLLWLGLLANSQVTFAPLQDAVIGAVVGYVFLWGVYWLFKLITGKEGMGYGDFKLFAAIGAWVGWQLLPIVIFVAASVGAVVGLSLIALNKIRNDQAMPFGPFLALAGVLALLFGDAALHIVYRLFVTP